MTETLDMPRAQTKCPRCAETVDQSAVSCPHCGAGLRDEAPTAAPTRFTLDNAPWGGFLELNPFSRNGIFISTNELTLEGGGLTVAGTYVGRKTVARAVGTWAVFTGTLVALFLLLWQVLFMPAAIGIAIILASFPTSLLDWVRRRSVTLERAAADVTVKKIKGRRIECRGPFELERADGRIKVMAYAHTKEDAAALAEVFARKDSSSTS